jgi:hypothetical protein
MFAKPTNTNHVLTSSRPVVNRPAPPLPASPANLLTQVLSTLAWNG